MLDKKEWYEYIDKFHLTEWWNTFSDEEKRAIYSIAIHIVADTPIGSSLATISSHLNNSRTRPAALRIAQESFKRLQGTNLQKVGEERIVDLHFDYMHLMKVFYRSREEVPGMLGMAIKAAKAMIQISPIVSKSDLIKIPTVQKDGTYAVSPDALYQDMLGLNGLRLLQKSKKNIMR